MTEKHVWRFAEAGRRLVAAATALGVQAPSFRTPPRVAELDRTIRRASDGSVLVSVRSRGRPPQAVLADMIEGVIAANNLQPTEATQVRNELWQATADIGDQAAPTELVAPATRSQNPSTSERLTALRAA